MRQAKWDTYLIAIMVIWLSEDYSTCKSCPCIEPRTLNRTSQHSSLVPVSQHNDVGHTSLAKSLLGTSRCISPHTLGRVHLEADQVNRCSDACKHTLVRPYSYYGRTGSCRGLGQGFHVVSTWSFVFSVHVPRPDFILILAIPESSLV